MLSRAAYSLSMEARSFYPKVGGGRIFQKYGTYLPCNVATHSIQEYHTDLCSQVQWLRRIEAASRRTVNIVGGDLIVHCGKKSSHEHVGRDSSVGIATRYRV